MCPLTTYMHKHAHRQIHSTETFLEVLLSTEYYSCYYENAVGVVPTTSSRHLRSCITRTEDSDWQSETCCLVNTGPTLHNNPPSQSNIRSVIAVRGKNNCLHENTGMQTRAQLAEYLICLMALRSEILSFSDIVRLQHYIFTFSIQILLFTSPM